MCFYMIHDNLYMLCYSLLYTYLCSLRYNNQYSIQNNFLRMHYYKIPYILGNNQCCMNQYSFLNSLAYNLRNTNQSNHCHNLKNNYYYSLYYNYWNKMSIPNLSKSLCMSQSNPWNKFLDNYWRMCFHNPHTPSHRHS